MGWADQAVGEGGQPLHTIGEFAGDAQLDLPVVLGGAFADELDLAAGAVLGGVCVFPRRILR